MRTFEVSLANRHGDRKAHQTVKAESMAEAIVQAEQDHYGLMVNKCTEVIEHIYRVELVFSHGATSMYNNIKAYSEADAARIARMRNPQYDVVGIQKIS